MSIGNGQQGISYNLRIEATTFVNPFKLWKKNQMNI